MTVPTNAGFAEIAKLATNTGTPAAFTYIAVGTGTAPSASGEALASEVVTAGLERVTAATISTVQTTQPDDTANWAHVFTHTGAGTITVSEAGIFNASSAGDMLIVGAISPTAAMVNGDTLTLTMKCQFKADA